MKIYLFRLCNHIRLVGSPFRVVYQTKMQGFGTTQKMGATVIVISYVNN